jgi:hypothetical protein
MKKAFIFILILLQFSCGTKYKLNSNSFDWQPYKIGDKLVFESNTDEIDTIFVKDIERNKNPDDQLAIFPNYDITYSISGEISLTNPFTSSIEKKVTKDYVNILKLSPGKETDYLTLNFDKRGDTLKHPIVVVEISELNSKFKNISKYESIEIDAKSYYDNLQVKYDLKSFY